MAEKQSPGWKKYFKVADTTGQLGPISGRYADGFPGYGKNNGTDNYPADMVYRNYASRLPEVYSGHPNRIERYNQYENMDMDSEINACLDIIAEFSTQLNEQNGTPFEVKYSDTPTDHEIDIIRKQLQQWTKLNKLDQRIFKLFRNTIKYGDQIFVRDPETFEMMWVDMSKVARVIVNESEGKRPEQYVIRDINPNFQNMTVAAKTTTDYMTNPVTGTISGAANYTMPNGGTGGGVGNSRFMQAMNEVCLDAKHVVHMSLNEGLDVFWPFGKSILENIYKVFKQKELLEDSILIYRVSRAPERRIFKIDVGNMPSHLAMQFVERIKNEMARGLRVPSSYLPTGPDDSGKTFDDGKVGTALIQEYRFNQYCERLQALICQKLDDEFKMFMKWRGFNIDSSLFNIKFNAPQNFASYRQSELDNTRIQAFTSMEQLPYMSKRFMLERFLGLTEDEIKKNEEMWREERDSPEMKPTTGQDLRSVGITPGALETDIQTGEDIGQMTPDGGMGGMPGAVPPAPGGMPGGAAPPPV
jgi:hypothetical protein